MEEEELSLSLSKKAAHASLSLDRLWWQIVQTQE